MTSETEAFFVVVVVVQTNVSKFVIFISVKKSCTCKIELKKKKRNFFSWCFWKMKEKKKKIVLFFFIKIECYLMFFTKLNDWKRLSGGDNAVQIWSKSKSKSKSKKCVFSIYFLFLLMKSKKFFFLLTFNRTFENIWSTKFSRKIIQKRKKNEKWTTYTHIDIIIYFSY